MREITPFLIEQHHRQRIPAGARVCSNRELAALKQLFNDCRTQRRPRFLEPDEGARRVQVAASPLKELLIVGINAGLRIEAEAPSFRWEDVDFWRGFLTVQAAYAKNRTTRTILLNARALAALAALEQHARGPFIFSRTPAWIHSFARLVKRVGLAGTEGDLAQAPAYRCQSVGTSRSGSADRPRAGWLSRRFNATRASGRIRSLTPSAELRNYFRSPRPRRDNAMQVPEMAMIHFGELA